MFFSLLIHHLHFKNPLVCKVSDQEVEQTSGWVQLLSFLMQKVNDYILKNYPAYHGRGSRQRGRGKTVVCVCVSVSKRDGERERRATARKSHSWEAETATSRELFNFTLMCCVISLSSISQIVPTPCGQKRKVCMYKVPKCRLSVSWRFLCILFWCYLISVSLNQGWD